MLINLDFHFRRRQGNVCLFDQWRLPLPEIYFLKAVQNRSWKMGDNVPVVKNEAALEELNKRIIEIKRKIVLKGESSSNWGTRVEKLENLMTFSLPTPRYHYSLPFFAEGQKKANIEDWVSLLTRLFICL